MTYRPERRLAFGPPLRQRLPSIAYLTFALGICAAIAYGQIAPSNSRMFVYVVEGDRNRMIPSSVCAIILFVSAIAAVLREQMRGVIVHPDGIELRELLSLGWPRIRRFHWSQIDKLFVPAASGAARTNDLDASLLPKPTNIRLDLWDGSRAWLPPVAKLGELGLILEKVALARAIPVEGGTGLLDDLGNPLEDG